MSTDILALTHRCPTCHTPAVIDHETRRLPCGHVAFMTEAGIVVGWANSVANALNLERVLNSWEAAPLAGVRHAPLTELRREAEVHRLSCVSSVDANDYGGTASKVEALVSRE